MAQSLDVPAQGTSVSTRFYTYTEVLDESRKYFAGEELPARVFADKYALRDKEGRYLESNPNQMHDRLASEFARIDSEYYGLDFKYWYDVYRDALNNFQRIVPQGSPMSAIGNSHQVQSASNCVVVESPKDSIDGIFDSARDIAQLQKRRCGTGIDISTLRPSGVIVRNAAKTTSGAWSFADFYSFVTRMIGQGGRRGALMLTLDVHHPDVEQFATMKNDKTKVTGANVSIRLSDAFLKAVVGGTTYEQRWPLEGEPRIRKQVDARTVWKTIVDSATTTAEPGLLFWDAVKKFLPAESYSEFKSVSTNPCSEIPLSPFDSCRLISLNLTGYVRDAFAANAYFDYEAFSHDVGIATQMSDNLVDLEIELITKIQEMSDSEAERVLWIKLRNAARNGRRVGLGTHGLADTLAMLNLKYDSNHALTEIDNIYAELRNTAYRTSVKLAKQRNPFPAFNWELERDNAYIARLPGDIKGEMAQSGRRNIAILTQAPTGSVSIVSKCGPFNRFNVSSGVEPVFRNSYTRRKRVNANDEGATVHHVDALGDKWEEFEVYHPNVLNYMEKMGENKLPSFFVTSDAIDWRFRVSLQGIEQYYIDHAISSTINLSKGTNSSVVGDIYLTAWKEGLKGITVYVDGSRDGVLLTKESKKIDPSVRPEKIVRMEAPKRPVKLPCNVTQATSEGQKWLVIVGVLEGEPYEVFMAKGETSHTFKDPYIEKKTRGRYALCDGDDIVIPDIIGTADDPSNASVTRLVSMSLRHGTPLDFVVEQLGRDGKINALNKVIARTLKRYIKEGQAVRSGVSCPQCSGRNLVYQEGCQSCKDCAYSKCN